MDEAHWKEILSHILRSPPDITLVGSNGSTSAHQLVLAAASPFLYELIQELEEPVLIIPEVNSSCLDQFKSLLYQGEVKAGNLEEIHHISYLIESLKIPMANMGVTFPENAIPRVTFVDPSLVENDDVESQTSSSTMEITESDLQTNTSCDNTNITVNDNITDDFESCMLESAEIVTDESMILDIEEDLGRLLDLAGDERSHGGKSNTENDLIIPPKCDTGTSAMTSNKLHLKSDPVSAMLSPFHDKKLDEIDQLLKEKLHEKKSESSYLSNNSFSSKSVVLENKNKFHQQCMCEICGVVITKNNLKQHMAIHDPKRLKQECVVCRKRYATKKELGEHYAETHYTGNGPFECAVCNSTIKKNIKNHLREHALHKLHQCEYCAESFRKPYLLKSHINFNHTKGTLNQCNVCSKVFSSKPNLTRHLEIHKENRKTITCFLCNNTYTSKEALSFHLRTHADYKPHVCVICSKSFVKKDKLEKHMKSHVKFYNCEVCKLAFKQKGKFQHHQDICRIEQLVEI